MQSVQAQSQSLKETDDPMVFLRNFKKVFEESLEVDDEDIQREHRKVVDSFASGPIQRGFVRNNFTWNTNSCKSNKRQSRDKTKYSFFINLHKKFDVDMFWNLFDLTIPMYPSRKYHSINTSQIQSLSDHTNVATWYLLWNECFGVEMMKYIRTKHEEFNETVLGPDIENKTLALNEWKENVDSVLEFLIAFHQLPTKNINQTNDSCKSARDFLMEPAVLMQLPWNLSMFHQWLIAALTETIIFEKETVEFRHFAMHTKRIVRNVHIFLTLIKHLKETLILGLLILHAAVSKSKKCTTKYPDYIMNFVIPRSTDVLKFILSGSAQRVVKSLKASAFPKEKTVLPDEHFFLDYRAFTVDRFLEHFFNRRCYSYPFWRQDKLPLFFQVNLLPSVARLAHTIKTNQTYSPNFKLPPAPMRKLSLEEECSMSANILQKIATGQVKEITLKMIKEVVIAQGHLPFVTAQEIEGLMAGYEYKADFDIGPDSNVKDCFSHLITESVIRYLHIQEALVECEKEKTTLGRMITAHMELVEREQLIRLVWYVAMLVDLKPVATKLGSFTPMSMRSVQFDLVTLETMVDEETFKGFILPEKFSDPVNVNEKPLLIEQKPNKIIAAFETRIGRIVFHALEQNFIKNSNGMEVFPYTNIVLYLLPSFVAMFAKSSEQEKNNCEKSFGLKNKLKLVDSLIKHYEDEYSQWLQSRKPKYLPTKEKDVRIDSLKKRIQACKDICQTLIRLFSAMLEDSPNELCKNLPLFISSNDGKYNFPFYCNNENVLKLHAGNKAIIDKWSKLSLNFLETLLQVTIESCEVPKPGYTLKSVSKEIRDLYFATCIMWELEKIYNMCEAISPMDKPLKSKLPENREQLYYEILRATLNSKKNIEGDVTHFIQKAKDVLRELLRYFKEYRYMKGFMGQQGMLVEQPELKKAVDSYLHGDFKQLEAMLLLSSNSTVYVCKYCKKSSNECIICPACVEQNFPEVNNYCSEECRDIWWDEEHYVEHLECELGLGKSFK